MSRFDEPDYFDDLKSFRWALYHYRKSREIVKCLSRYYFKKYNFEHFAEEIIIAGYDLQNVSKCFDETEVSGHLLIWQIKNICLSFTPFTAQLGRANGGAFLHTTFVS